MFRSHLFIPNHFHVTLILYLAQVPIAVVEPVKVYFVVG